MRYADSPGTEAEVSIQAAPSRVWDLVTDIELPIGSSPELRSVEWLNGATVPAVGATFLGHNENPMLGQWRTTSLVVDLVEQQTFAWAVVDADGVYGEPNTDPAKAMATWRYDLRAEGGGTLLRQSVQVGPGRSGLTKAIDSMPAKEEKIIAMRLDGLRTAMEANLQALKEAAEGR